MTPFVRILLISVLSVLIGHPVYSQTYVPDTSLTYDIFLQQCLDFKKERRQEIWLVHFWASWHSASLFEIPNLKFLHRQFQDKPVRFVSVSEDKVRSRWVDRLAEEEMPWEHLIVTRSADLDYLKRAFPYNSIPAYFVVDTRGAIERIDDLGRLETTLQRLANSLPNRPYQKWPVPARLNVPERPVPQPETPPAPAPGSDEDTEREPPSQGAWLTHTVQRGETLYRLYVRYGVPVSEIKAINGLSSNTIRVGQVLKIKRQ